MQNSIHEWLTFFYATKKSEKIISKHQFYSFNCQGFSLFLVA